MSWNIKFTPQAVKDLKNIKKSGFKDKAKKLLGIIGGNPFKNPPPYEKLSGNLCTLYSRRINIKHRLVYQVLKDEKIVKVLRLWTHYGD